MRRASAVASYVSLRREAIKDRRILAIVAIYLIICTIGLILLFAAIAYFSSDHIGTPCEDFALYSRSFWKERMPSVENKSTLAVKQMDIYKKIIDVYKSWTSDMSDSSAQAKGFKFFNACLKTDANSKIDLEILRKKFLDAVGGWPMIDASWKGDHDKAITALALIDKMGFYNGLFTIIKAQALLKNSKFNKEIFIGSGFEFFAISAFPRSDDTIIEDLIKLLVGHTLSETDKTEMKRFNESVINIRQQNDEEHLQNSTLNRLNKDTECNWSVFIFTSLDNGKVNISKRRFIYEEGYLKDICKLIQKTSPSTVVNYAIWTALTSVSYLLRGTLQDRGLTSIEREYYCVEIESSLMPFVITKIYKETLRNYEQIESNLKEITKDILSVLLQDLNDNIGNDLPVTESERIEIKLKNLRVLSCFPAWIKDENLNNYYSSLILSNDHQSNVFSVLAHARGKYLRELEDMKMYITWFVTPLSLTPFYNPGTNEMTIPISLSIFLERDPPKFLIYSTVGVLIAQQIMHVFDVTEIDFLKIGKKYKDLIILKDYLKIVECILGMYATTCYESACLERRSINTFAENFADILGLQHSFYAYKDRWRLNHEESVPSNFSDFNSLQMFFLGYAYLLQGPSDISSEQEFLHKVSKENTLPLQFRINRPVANMQKYYELFSCTEIYNFKYRCNLLKHGIAIRS